eukprot:Gb_01743 [translate_table: standard]
MEAVNLPDTSETPQLPIAVPGEPSTSSKQRAADASSSSIIQQNDGKQVVVRVKRKRQQAPIDALWLEINDRPLKRQEMGLTGLSLSDSTSLETKNSKRLLFHHVETVGPLDEEKGLIESILKARQDRKLESRPQERREGFKKLKDKQDKLRASARQQHESVVKSARFEQVWKSRKGFAEMSNDKAMHELYHLYDVVRVDVEEDMAKKASRRERAKSEAASKEGQLLCNYLPLMREFLPSAAAEFEAELCSFQTTEQDDYVYDVYTLGEGGNLAEDVAASFPLVQVEDEFYYGDPVESDVDSEDSNDENNPLNDYPEEESELEECQSKSSFYDSEEVDLFNEYDGDGGAFIDSDEEDGRWARRRLS